MKAGDHISVHAPDSYTDDATISAICHPDELPAIAGAPNVEQVRAILAEGSYVSVALIEYKFLDQVLAFIALEDSRGKWTDLKGVPLLIEPRQAENELDRLLKNHQQRRADGIRVVRRRRRSSDIDWEKF